MPDVEYPRDPAIEARFWAKVQKSDGCWLWTGAKTALGYGRFKADRTVNVPRYSYFLEHGPFPEQLVVRHQCDNPACVRPEHLLLGTFKDNAEDRRREQAKMPVVRPPKHRRKKLSEAQAEEIRRRFRSEAGVRQVLAKEYGVSLSTIDSVIYNRTWRDFRRPNR